MSEIKETVTMQISMYQPEPDLLQPFELLIRRDYSGKGRYVNVPLTSEQFARLVRGQNVTATATIDEPDEENK